MTGLGKKPFVSRKDAKSAKRICSSIDGLVINTVAKRYLNLTFVSFALFVVGYVRLYHEGHEEHEEFVAQEYVIELMKSCS